MEQFIEEDEDSKPLDAADDAWADPQRVADDLGQELPNAEVTDEVTPVVDAGDRPKTGRTSISRTRTRG